MSMRLFSPAKVNLFFKVIKKREDGYHEIASLIGAISLGDSLIFAHSDEERLFCDHPEVPLGEENLILKAAQLFRKRSGLSFRLSVTLEKRIPLQAGLGGASSNAATTLWGLNEMQKRPFSQKQLEEMGAELGSDVPFFFSEGFAFCSGRGEKLTPIPFLSLSHYVIAKPPYGLSTSLVYQMTRPDDHSFSDPLSCLQELQRGKVSCFNDLEPAAFRMRPELKAFKESLLKLGFQEVSMTGSGSAFLCSGHASLPIFKEEKGALFPVSFIQRKEKEWWRNSDHMLTS
ncbi:MAG: 4-(cytidine 5'-diphospho)-2-C-methyl-D-erythritol kinase [Chlamydiae bacterium GWC2_50_10]|nr:MAG: 4-(cytidine 5'-diphospho)-2-C-methyl-D-erythritol kinase [Chlamydiae bacterium GWA2_50_15]OGN54097.1 MAG: 4-(cytidine 5'-diphospho)-2-C-methyl-D-erythritol kinase [Chlamydiae bacterium GWC2_50_10]OGN54475.1 MAG: 4-(cytidine 5'-diphospho)-2-C-methyl-D-erythritol kinase [Chlamydiae bacterium GWF2_49_8]OGN57560.1 MAG: 4-(cytidine 5'-diphospho)-2-C-methyl-D-erythritol kinase [Chlamydiae bacterium RIFCSPHIGHO2_02_FULL_49_29]OGN63069.1 MAG: 4-(cytidine 5'-diphospho)-2-C-methyl-D-erythritol ki